MEWDFSKVFCFGTSFSLTEADGNFTVDFSVNRVSAWKTQQSPVAIGSWHVMGAVLCLPREGHI